jgi:uncharacterized repeat protein (TIGR01451 family)
VADLSAGENAGQFPQGVNQLFSIDTRLPLGRWPNLDDPAFDHGYSFVDSAPDARTLVDHELPPGDWTGAVVHLKAMRWYIVNREVAGSSGTALTLGADTSCWDGCGDPDPTDPTVHGWGYFLNGHRATLDQEGEWAYDAATNRVYLYTTQGPPSNIEGSVILDTDVDFTGGIILGQFKKDQQPHHVIIEHLAIERWFAHGITTPRNLYYIESTGLTLRENVIRDVDSTGIRLATWVYKAQDGDDGWRGGEAITIENNLIERANHFGIDSYAHHSRIAGNTLRDIGVVEYLGTSGLGCGMTGSNCTENGDGIRIKIGDADQTGHHNTVTDNVLERVGYCGMDVFGHTNVFEHNVIRQACRTKGDCGALRTFGRDSLNATGVYDLHIADNVIIDVPGNTDGANSTYKAPFGMGLYIDHYSRDIVVTGNTVVSATVDGILFQRSTGTVTGNTLYANGAGTMDSRGQAGFYKDETRIADFSDNVLYATRAYTITYESGWQAPSGAKTLTASSKDTIMAADNNRYFQPYLKAHIAVNGHKTLAEWQTYSGLDAHSQEAWFTLPIGAPPRSRLFINETNTTQSVDLGSRRYLDLDQGSVMGSLMLAPYSSQVLILDAALADLRLGMTLRASPIITPGATLTWTLTLTNAGALTATDTVLTHTLPLWLVDTAWTTSPELAGAAPHPDTRYTWDLPDLAPAVGGTLTLTARYSETARTDLALALVATVSAAGEDANPADNYVRLPLGVWRHVYLPLVIRF